MPIPVELRQCAQWLVSGSDKAPVSPKTGLYADVRNRNLFVSYEEACVYANQHGLNIGFALTPDDPFAVIDLDSAEADAEQVERQRKIYDSIDTYAELSRSQRGVHIWMRGSVPHGVRRDKVEVYSSDRYMICTGWTLKDAPVADGQELLNVLFSEMDRGLSLTDLEDVDETISDQDVFEMAINAANGDKFDRLSRGEWRDEYPSQSEADFALMNMLCFYTRSNEQAMRLFRMTPLGKRDKAQRDKYLEYMIRKIRAEQAPMVDLSEIDFSTLLNGNGKYEEGEELERFPNVEIHPPHHPTPNGKHLPAPLDFTPPPGFMGELAGYIYNSSTRPVPEVATAAAIAMCAGVVGRQFNISGTGLNQYLILLAKTGVGKEDGPRGIERIFKAVRERIPMIDDFVGPGSFASGQGMARTINERPCFFSILGEFGYTLQELSDVNPTSLTREMKRMLLDLYSKSGKSGVVPPKAYSDKEKNTKMLYAPCVTLFGESTPEAFYEGLSLHHIESGLIPRFLIIEYQGDRTDRNPRAFEAPPPALVARFSELAEIALRMQANQSWQDVELDSGAKHILDLFDAECDERIRAGANEAIRQLWNRAHLKALRLCALLAVVDRPHAGMETADGKIGCVISPEEALWAVNLVSADAHRLSARFEAGDVGEGDSKQMADLERVIRDFVHRPIGELEKYGVTPTMKYHGCVPYVYVQRRVLPLSSFRKDRRGATSAVRAALVDLCEQGKLVEMNKLQAQQTFGSSGKVYKIVGKF